MITYRCPNTSCEANSILDRRHYRKDGHYVTRHNSQSIQRYECRLCGAKFSAHTYSDIRGQHRPELNQKVFGFYSSAVTQRRLARLLGCTYRTVVRKFNFLADRARQIHEERLRAGQLRSSFVSFDEMESFIRTRKLPVAIALAVRNRTGEIIDARVATMPSFGLLAESSVRLYGRQPDRRESARRTVLGSIQQVARTPQITILTDELRAYNPLISDVLPDANHIAYSSRRATRDERNPMWMLNHVCALIRADLSRMARRTWVTSKRIEALQRHLDLYMAWHNGYQVVGHQGR